MPCQPQCSYSIAKTRRNPPGRVVSDNTGSLVGLNAKNFSRTPTYASFYWSGSGTQGLFSRLS